MITFVMKYGVFHRADADRYILLNQISFEAKSIIGAKRHATKLVNACEDIARYKIPKSSWQPWRNLGAAFDAFTDDPVMYSERLSKTRSYSSWRGYMRIFWRKNDILKESDE